MHTSLPLLENCQVCTLYLWKAYGGGVQHESSPVLSQAIKIIFFSFENAYGSSNDVIWCNLPLSKMLAVA